MNVIIDDIFKNKIISDSRYPFKDNKFPSLVSFANNLKALIKAEIEKQKDQVLIISIYADYGFGKTTFVDMLGRSLINDGNLAIKFDAFGFDYADPAISLIGEVNRQLGQNSIELEQAIPLFSMFPGVNNVLKKFKEREDILEKCHSNLKEYFRDKMLYFFIDELDRCNPIFAIRILEIAKHLFNVKGICFIVTINKSSLVSTVKSVYGFDNDQSLEYLERFFDFQFKLPEPSSAQYAEILFRKHIENINNDDGEITIDVFKMFFVSFKFSLREIEKQEREFRVFMDINNNHERNTKIPDEYMPLVALFLCLKRKNFRAYEQIKTRSPSSATSFLIENGLNFNEDIGFLYQALLSSKNKQDLRSFLDEQSIDERDNREYKFKKIFYKIKLCTGQKFAK